MRALVQRVSRAAVRIDDEVVGGIGAGLCALVGVTHPDDDAQAAKLARKLWEMRIFKEGEGAMNVPLSAVSGEVLVVSQFTLYGDTRKGRRPSFLDAAPPDQAEPLVVALVSSLR